MAKKIASCQETLNFVAGTSTIYSPNWSSTGITLGTSFALCIVVHLLITTISNKKSAKFFEGDAERKPSVSASLISENKQL